MPTLVLRDSNGDDHGFQLPETHACFESQAVRYNGKIYIYQDYDMIDESDDVVVFYELRPENILDLFTS